MQSGQGRYALIVHPSNSDRRAKRCKVWMNFFSLLGPRLSDMTVTSLLSQQTMWTEVWKTARTRKTCSQRVTTSLNVFCQSCYPKQLVRLVLPVYHVHLFTVECRSWHYRIEIISMCGKKGKKIYPTCSDLYTCVQTLRANFFLFLIAVRQFNLSFGWSFNFYLGLPFVRRRVEGCLKSGLRSLNSLHSRRRSIEPRVRWFVSFGTDAGF